MANSDDVSDKELEFLQLLASNYVKKRNIEDLNPIEQVALVIAKMRGEYDKKLNQELRKYHGYDLSQLKKREPEFVIKNLNDIVHQKEKAIRNLIPKPINETERRVKFGREDDEDIFGLYQSCFNNIGYIETIWEQIAENDDTTKKSGENRKVREIKEYVILNEFDKKSLNQLIDPLIELADIQVKIEAIKRVQEGIASDMVYRFHLCVKTVPEACRDVLKRVGGHKNITVSQLKEIVNDEYVIQKKTENSTINELIDSWVQNYTKNGREFKSEKKL